VSTTVTITTQVKQFYKVSVNVGSVKHVKPGAGNFVYYNITVKNEGNGVDYFTLNTEAQTGGWSSDLSKSSTANLNPAGTESLKLYVYPPINEDAGVKGYVWVNATSGYSPATAFLTPI